MVLGRTFRLEPVVPLEAVDASLRERVGPDAPPPARMMAAKAMLPADPPDMVAMLAYLGAGDDKKLAPAAADSLAGLPESLLLAALGGRLHAGVLDFCATVFLRTPKALEALVLNSLTSDEAIAWIASKSNETRVLEIIAQNQVRILRSADIPEALYFNADTPTGAANRAMETAVRGGLDLGHIPGFKEIAAAILGQGEVGAAPEFRPDDSAAPPADSGESVAEVVEEASAAEAAPVATEAPASDADADRALKVLSDGAQADPMSEAFFDYALRMASTGEDVPLVAATGDVDGEGDASSGKALWRLIREMTIPQKVRLALVGNSAARQLLIRDSKRTVAMSVLRSPGLTEKEIAGFASNKSLGDEIIRTIANNREWTRSYQIKISLLSHPKCPPNRAAGFLASLRDKDLKSLAKSRDVPSHISRNAKRVAATREQKRKGSL